MAYAWIKMEAAAVYLLTLSPATVSKNAQPATGAMMETILAMQYAQMVFMDMKARLKELAMPLTSYQDLQCYLLINNQASS